MGWLRPTSYNDAENKWVYEATAYDGNTATHAITSPGIAAGTWSSFLEFSRASIPCSKLRFYCLTYDYATGSIDIDAYYGGAWHDVYQGSYTKVVWVEKSLGATYDVTKVRIRLYNPDTDNRMVAIREINLYYIEAPTVSSQAVTAIDDDEGTGNGNITDIGSENASKRGFVWNTSGSPTIADDSVIEEGDFGTGAFTGSISGLDPGVKYYVKAFAYNEAGYAYGAEVDFTTDKRIPVVTCQAPSSVLPTTATGNGNITDLGGENSTERGFEWGLTQVNTWEAHDSGSFSAGAFTKALTGFVANTTYWIRSYAVNSEGTAYSAWRSFQTSATGTIPTGTRIFICSDYSAYTYKLMRAETDDGATYIGYFVVSTDLTNKQGLAWYKRILDLHLYVKSQESGTLTIEVKRDNEASWQSVGSVSLVGTESILVQHLAPDIRGKVFEFKISAANAFSFLGMLFEYLPEDLR